MVRRIEHATHTEWFLTACPHVDSQADVSATDPFVATAELLAGAEISVMQEKLYGLRRSRGEILETRAAALARVGLEPDWPVTFLEGTPASGGPWAGSQLWGVTPRPGAGQRIETVRWQGRMVGREWLGPDFRQLVLASIDGTGAGAGGADSPSSQAQRMFENATAVLMTRGYTFPQVARTWIYLSRILDWYGDFNRIRNAHFATAGYSMAGPAPFPASTGIQARRESEECLMDLLAIDASPASALTVRPLLRSGRQDPAFSYGSAFSRAMVVERHGKKVIHVSGTASIDADGRSTHPGDAPAQYRETLLSIAALLEPEGASLLDICQGTLFTSSPAAAESCREMARRLDLPALPLIEVVADVCRPELLVEVEAVATV